MSAVSASLNSYRMQRAHRINTVEEGRLRRGLTVINNERNHTLRLTNQEIRLLKVVMDTIPLSSGYSPEGRSPHYVEEAKSDETDVAFMYGQRTRRYSTTSTRVRSAPISGVTCTTPRPPRPGTGNSGVAEEDSGRMTSPKPGTNKKGSVTSQSEGSERGGSPEAPSNGEHGTNHQRAQTAGVARSNLKVTVSRSGNPDQRSTRSTSAFVVTGNKAAEVKKRTSRDDGRNRRQKLPVSSFMQPFCSENEVKINETANQRRARVMSAVARQPSARNIAISRAVTEARAVTSSNAKLSAMTSEEVWLVTRPLNVKKQQLQEKLLRLNKLKLSRVEHRMKEFLSRYPVIERVER